MKDNYRFFSISVFVSVLCLIVVMGGSVLANGETFTIPDVLTDDESFYLCSSVPLDKNCDIGTVTIDYEYDSPISTVPDGVLSYYNLEFDVDMDIYCKKLKVNMDDLVRINGSCDASTKIQRLNWVDSYLVNDGAVQIQLLSASTGEYIYGNVSETMTFKVDLLDVDGNPVGGDEVNFAVRNYTGEILKKEIMVYDSSEGAYLGNYTFIKGAPYGFIEFNGLSDSWEYGGKYYYFKTNSFISNLSINNSYEDDYSYFLKEQIPIKINYDNYYGEITSIVTTMNMVYDDGGTAVIDLPLNLTNDEYVYNIAGDSPGNYTLQTVVSHSTGDIQVHTKNIRVDGFYLEINTDPFWEAGDNITFSAWIEDKRSNPSVVVKSNVTFKLIPPSGSTLSLKNKNATQYKHKSNYATINTTTLGYYTLQVNAVDLYGHNYERNYIFTLGGVYTNQFIEVMRPDPFIIDVNTNYSVDIVVENIKGQKLYGLDVYEKNDSDNIYVDLSDSDLDIDADNSTNVTIIVDPTNMANGDYVEMIIVEINDDTLEVPLKYTMDRNPILEISNRYFNDSKFDVTLFEGIASKEVIKLKNIGSRSMGKPTIYFVGNNTIENISAIQPTDALNVGDEDEIIINFKYDAVGVYEGQLGFAASNFNDVLYNITVRVIVDLASVVLVISDKVSVASNLRDSLEYNSTDRDLNLNFTVVDEMISNATNLRSHILSASVDPANYDVVQENITELENMLSDIDEKLDEMEQTYSLLIKPKSGDGKCEAEEACSSSDCTLEDRCKAVAEEEPIGMGIVCGDGICSKDEGECSTCPSDCRRNAVCESLLEATENSSNTSGGFPVGIVVGVILLLIIAVVLVTSLVPEDENGNPIGQQAGFDLQGMINNIKESLSKKKEN